MRGVDHWLGQSPGRSLRRGVTPADIVGDDLIGAAKGLCVLPAKARRYSIFGIALRLFHRSRRNGCRRAGSRTRAAPSPPPRILSADQMAPQQPRKPTYNNILRLHRFGCRGHALSVIQCVRGRSDRGRPCTGRCLSTRQLITAGREALVHEVVPVFDPLIDCQQHKPIRRAKSAGADDDPVSDTNLSRSSGAQPQRRNSHA